MAAQPQTPQIGLPLASICRNDEERAVNLELNHRFRGHAVAGASLDDIFMLPRSPIHLPFGDLAGENNIFAIAGGRRVIA